MESTKLRLSLMPIFWSDAGDVVAAELAEAGRRGAVLEDERRASPSGSTRIAVGAGRIAGGVERLVGRVHVERQALRVRKLPVVGRGGVGAGVVVRIRSAREDGLPERLLVDRLQDGLAHDDVLERGMALALAETGLVHVEVLIEPRRLEDGLADGRIDVLDRIVVGLDQVEGDVDLAVQERGDLAFLVVGEELDR